jgi:hypothetical protein
MAISAYDVKRLTLEDDSNAEELLYNFKVRQQLVGHVHSCHVLLSLVPSLKMLLLPQMPVGS